ncbi:hypothetical protein O1611_g3133 [Lasiodiplodia mahajangana]|uniref:Uncharacterized protein n=1 Tax=Lasiodiplodia mahajangana TaxID=1108764 RepID=A0ACC2JT30_9PEZI|nr:hypothetical protein O1611_g3133 [Lasiodiplodia mahajangana]
MLELQCPILESDHLSSPLIWTRVKAPNGRSVQIAPFPAGHLGHISDNLDQHPSITSDSLNLPNFLDPSFRLEGGHDFSSFLLPSQIFGTDWPRAEPLLSECLIQPPMTADESGEKAKELSQNVGYVIGDLKQLSACKVLDSQVCPDPGCGYKAKTRRDVNRHYQSVHKKTMSFYCHWPGCPRGLVGWYRKDLRDRHARTAHKNGKQRSPSTSKPDPDSKIGDGDKESLSSNECMEDSKREGPVRSTRGRTTGAQEQAHLFLMPRVDTSQTVQDFAELFFKY